MRTDIGTVARIVESAEMPDGRWALVAVGVRRIRVQAWLPDDPYPRADVEDWPDPAPGPEHAEMLDHTVATLRRALALTAEVGEQAAPATIELAEDPTLAGYQALAVAPIGPLDRHALLVAESPEARLAGLQVLLQEAIEVLQLRLAGG